MNWITLRVIRADGEVEDFPLTDRGGTIACAFGRVGFRSSVWNITVKPQGDVYVSTPPLADDWKISLHAYPLRDVPGDWQAGFIRNQATKSLTPSGLVFQAATGSRVFDRHRRPPAGAGGAPDITTALTIGVVHEDVQRWPYDDTPAGSVRWSDPPGPGWAAMFQILFVPVMIGMEHVLEDVEGIVAAFGTRTGDAVLITSQPVPLDDQEQAAAAALRTWVGQNLTDDKVISPGSGDPERAIWLRPSTAGHREIWDLALPEKEG